MTAPRQSNFNIGLRVGNWLDNEAGQHEERRREISILGNVQAYKAISRRVESRLVARRAGVHGISVPSWHGATLGFAILRMAEILPSIYRGGRSNGRVDCVRSCTNPRLWNVNSLG